MKILTITLVFISIVFFANAQQKQYKMGCIAFYNLENLFDTIDSQNTNDVEFLPNGTNRWNTAKYYEKLNNMATAISSIGSDFVPVPPPIIGVSEIENRQVLEDLVKQEPLQKYNYKIIHYDSPDLRGVDVGLLYQEQVFKVTNTSSVRLNYPPQPDFKTRDQLVVSGIFDGEPLHIIVLHWPSRRGGEKRSRPLRNAAASLTRSIVDSILITDNNAKIIVMGDLNDDPVNQSVQKNLNSTGNIEKIEQNQMFNPFYNFYKKGIGSNAYNDVWSNFDQIIVSPALVKTANGYKFYKAQVFNKPFLTQTDGRFKGYPLRTYSFGNYIGGYSDHFPVYILLVKQL